VTPVTHLPRERFLGVLRRAAAMVGNSSGALIEAAAIRPGGVPVVNIGSRQAGREKPGHVIDCEYGRAAVEQALTRIVQSPPRAARHPYGSGDTGTRIARFLAEFRLDTLSSHKRNTY